MWAAHFPAGQGEHQSPVNFDGKQVEFDPDLQPLHINYNKATIKDVTNTGNGMQVNYDQSKPASKGVT